MPEINASTPDWYTRTLPTQASSAVQDQQISANLLHGIQSRQEQQQIGQRQQQIDMARQQQNALLPLRAKQMENQAILQGIAIKHGFDQQQDDIETAQAITDMSGYLQRAFRGGIGGEPQTEAGMYGILKRYPKAADAKPVQDMFMQLKIAQQATQAEKMANFKADESAMEKGAALDALNERSKLASDARLGAAQLSADARVSAASLRATKWADHAKEVEFRAAMTRLAKDPTITDDNEYAARVEKLEERFGPSGMNPATAAPASPPVRMKRWNPQTRQLE